MFFIFAMVVPCQSKLVASKLASAVSPINMKRSLQRMCPFQSGSISVKIYNGRICTKNDDCPSGRCVFERRFIGDTESVWDPSGYNASTNKLDLCEGGCDKDSQCQEGLRCYLDEGNTNNPYSGQNGHVPGCGSASDLYSNLGDTGSGICYAEEFNADPYYDDTYNACGICLKQRKGGICFRDEDCRSNNCNCGICIMRTNTPLPDCPSSAPSNTPSSIPSSSPSNSPSNPTSNSPSSVPSSVPSNSPSNSPTFIPGTFAIDSTGSVTGITTSSSNIRLTAPYNSTDHFHETFVLSPDCITPFTGTTADAFTITDSPDVSLGGGYISYNSMIDIDISKVMNGTEWDGILNLCLESAVYYERPDGTNEKMDFVKNNITLTLEANFEVDSINAERKDATKAHLYTGVSEYVEAYQCVKTAADTPLTYPLPTYKLGDNLIICVRGMASADDIIDVASIKELWVSQSGGTSSPYTYVKDGSPVSTELAKVECGLGFTKVCVAEIVLLGRFFSVENPGDLIVSGEVVLEFSSSPSRHLQVLFSIQEEEETTGFRRATEGGGGFNLIIPLVAVEESTAFPYGTILVVSAVTTVMGVSVLGIAHFSALTKKYQGL